MNTLQFYKEQVALDYGYSSWQDCSDDMPIDFDAIFTKAATLYAEEACKPKWISVEDYLPDSRKLVLSITGKNKFVGFYTKGHDVSYEDNDCENEYDPVEEQNGTLYLKPGWYEEVEQHNSDYDSIYIKRDVTYWMYLPDKPLT